MYALTAQQARDIGSAIRRPPEGNRPQLLGGKSSGIEIVWVAESVLVGDDGLNHYNQPINVRVRTVQSDGTLSSTSVYRTFHYVDVPAGMLFFSDGSRLLYPVNPSHFGTVTTAIGSTGRGVVSITTYNVGGVAINTSVSRVQCIVGNSGSSFSIPANSVVELQLSVQVDFARWNVTAVRCTSITSSEL